jgi:hypothetical protein
VPYGIYDLAANSGWVSIGVDHDTAAFAVNSIRQWWRTVGRARYPEATRLLDHRRWRGQQHLAVRLWKRELQELANGSASTSRSATCRPAPASGTKSNTASSPSISQNWRAKPLVSYRVIVELISATTTKTGLTGAL